MTARWWVRGGRCLTSAEAFAEMQTGGAPKTERMYPPPGLPLSLGDGSAVQVTKQMLRNALENPVRAWAAVAPDGTLRPAFISRYASHCRYQVRLERGGTWPEAYRVGWRVRRVKIEVMEGGK